MSQTSPPTRRRFLQVVSGCALGACSAPPTLTPRPNGDMLITPGDLQIPQSSVDLASPDDMQQTLRDLSGPPGDLVCAGLPVPAAYMPALNEAKYWPDQSVFVARDSKGYMALSPICHHQGFSVRYMPLGGVQAFVCPQHGSTFRLDGSKIQGLSPDPMDHLGLCWKDANKNTLLLNPNLLLPDVDQRVT